MISFGGGSSKSKSSPKKVDVWNEGQKALWDPLWKTVQEGVNKEVPAYPGQMYVSKTPEEQAYLGSVSGGQAGRQTAIDALLSGKVPYDIGPQWAENYFETGIRPLAMREHEQVVDPGIRSNYAGPGYWGSARAGAETKADTELATDLAAQKAGLMYGEELAKRTAMESAEARRIQGLTAAAQEAETMGQAGAYSRSIDQEKVQADLQRWLQGETVDGVVPEQYSPWLKMIYNILGLEQYVVGQKSTSSAWDASLGIASSDGTTPSTGDVGTPTYYHKIGESIYSEKIENGNSTFRRV